MCLHSTTSPARKSPAHSQLFFRLLDPFDRLYKEMAKTPDYSNVFWYVLCHKLTYYVNISKIISSDSC